MQSIKNIKNNIEQGVIIGLLLVLMVSFISLGFYVVENNVSNLMGVYESPGVVYISQVETNKNSKEHLASIIQTSGQVPMSKDIETSKDREANQGLSGLNNLAMVLDKKIENKAHLLIVWVIDKVSIAIEHMADALSKTLQSS